MQILFSKEIEVENHHFIDYIINKFRGMYDIRLTWKTMLIFS